jgi:hypothetical protein
VQLYKLLCQSLYGKPVRLSLIFDSCHSESVMNLPYEYSINVKNYQLQAGTDTKYMSAPASSQVPLILCFSGCSNAGMLSRTVFVSCFFFKCLLERGKKIQAHRPTWKKQKMRTPCRSARSRKHTLTTCKNVTHRAIAKQF